MVHLQAANDKLSCLVSSLFDAPQVPMDMGHGLRETSSQSLGQKLSREFPLPAQHVPPPEYKIAFTINNKSH